MAISFKEREVLRSSIQNYLVKNQGAKDAEIVKHFLKEGYSRSTIYCNIKRMRSEKPIKQINTGRQSKLFEGRKSNQLKKASINRKGVTLRKLGKKFNVHHTTIHRKLVKMNIRYYKRKKTPKYTEKAALKAKRRSRKLVNELYGKDLLIIMEDEKYFTFYNDKIPSNSGFYTDNKEDCPDDVKYKGEDKYKDHMLVWIAISARGISEPLIRPVKAPAKNQHIYLKECLSKRLLPFISQHHSDENYIFWPDGAKPQ